MRNPWRALAPQTKPLTGTGARAYGLAVLATAATVALTRFTWPLFAGTPFAPLFAGIAVTTHWGTGPAGLVAILLAVACTPLAFPSSGPYPWDPRTLAIFIPVAVISSRIIAGRNRTAAALRATVAAERQAQADLRASEERLRRAQKMEAVGQLVAGVAHNFNNLMTVTMGYTEILEDRDSDDAAKQSAIEEIRKATERGAALTRQLLAFGRMHDTRPARIDLNRTIVDLRAMLTRAIREDIALTIDVAPAPAAIVIDPHDLEQVVVNLVMNARDALPAGGTIRIDVSRETVDASIAALDAPVVPGEYVRLRVRDNGIGMTPEVQSHLFEPFFTTKDVGEGTGLGLAFVHGIARHEGGFVAVESAPAKGTTVSVYLPPAGRDGDAPLRVADGD